MEVIKTKSSQMQDLYKVSIDLFFCLMVGFLIIQASNSAQQNEEISDLLSIESDRITANSWNEDEQLTINN